ncbi:hypothetical protein C7S16_3410 [Burkholderia thailandensis]|uniref:Uncharacterized protein n=1 Tax=Burkholderia thailandensis TaxID=57975 RepID=A0AAW9CZF4_BURTH|nr:hypothetical protein [Burkholderia thailandensis]MDW9256283.1 hypothetical protein [Burkholderia thailandensis]
MTGRLNGCRACAGSGGRLTTSLAAFVVNPPGTSPGRFARPQSSQQIGALSEHRREAATIAGQV